MRVLVEVAFSMVYIIGLVYIAQFVVGLFNWPARHNNAIYRFLGFLTSPITRAVRAITPEKIADKHVPVVAFFLLFWVYVALMFTRLCMLRPHLCDAF